MSIVCVIITAFSNSLIISCFRLSVPFDDSSEVLSLWCSCITEFVVTINCEIIFDINCELTAKSMKIFMWNCLQFSQKKYLKRIHQNNNQTDVVVLSVSETALHEFWTLYIEFVYKYAGCLRCFEVQSVHINWCVCIQKIVRQKKEKTNTNPKNKETHRCLSVRRHFNTHTHVCYTLVVCNTHCVLYQSYV